MPHIYQLSHPDESLLLRTTLAPFDFAAHTPAEIEALIRRMKRDMHDAQGIGLAANQIGLNMRVFVGQVPNAAGKPKFYALFNPTIEPYGDATDVGEEGCLSVPGVYGPVRRTERVILRGFDKRGKPVTIKAWGLLARMFQHEVDHLNGILFVDHAAAHHV